MSSNDFGAMDFFAKNVLGHKKDMSCVLKCVLKFSRGQNTPFPTKSVEDILPKYFSPTHKTKMNSKSKN